MQAIKQEGTSVYDRTPWVRTIPFLLCLGGEGLVLLQCAPPSGIVQIGLSLNRSSELLRCASKSKIRPLDPLGCSPPAMSITVPNYSVAQTQDLESEKEKQILLSTSSTVKQN